MTPDANVGFVGVFEDNKKFANARYLAEGIIHGSEAIASDSNRLLHTLLRMASYSK
jgi:hypothetical protein